MTRRHALVGLLAALAACGPSRGPADVASPASAPAEAAKSGREPSAEPATASADRASAASPPVAEPPADSSAAPTPVAEPSVERLDVAALLGRSRADVEAALGRPRGAAAGWFDHGELAARYRGGRCVGLKRHVPTNMDCKTAAESLGFRSGFPLRRADGCEWPGISERHRLAPGVAGRYSAVTGELEVWLRGE